MATPGQSSKDNFAALNLMQFCPSCLPAAIPKCCGDLHSEGNAVWVRRCHSAVSTATAACGAIPRDHGRLQEEGEAGRFKRDPRNLSPCHAQLLHSMCVSYMHFENRV